jgi:hypothetical protein
VVVISGKHQLPYKLHASNPAAAFVPRAFLFAAGGYGFSKNWKGFAADQVRCNSIEYNSCHMIACQRIFDVLVAMVCTAARKHTICLFDGLAPAVQRIYFSYCYCHCTWHSTQNL